MKTYDAETEPIPKQAKPKRETRRQREARFALHAALLESLQGATTLEECVEILEAHDLSRMSEPQKSALQATVELVTGAEKPSGGFANGDPNKRFAFATYTGQRPLVADGEILAAVGTVGDLDLWQSEFGTATVGRAAYMAASSEVNYDGMSSDGWIDIPSGYHTTTRP